MFGARADNRTAFCTAKTWFAEAAATARSRCGLRSREYTKFSAKRPRRSENSGTQRTHPRTYRFNQFHLFDGLFLFGAGWIIEPFFLRSKNMVRRSSDFCNAKIDCGVSNERFFREPHQRSKKCEMQSTHPRRFHLSDIRKDVCLCLGRERIIEPIFAQQKHSSPKRRKKKLFPTVKSRASNELREPHQRSQFGKAQRTHPRRFHLSDIRKDVCLCLGRGG